MGFAENVLCAQIDEAQDLQLSLAKTMIRKYWGNEYLHKLGSDREILEFAKIVAEKVDMLEKIAEFFGDEYAEFCFKESLVKQVYREQKPMFEVYRKAEVLSHDTRKEAVFAVDNKTLKVINTLIDTSLNKYLLIVHNEGAKKAEEVRNSAGGLRSFSAEYIDVYKIEKREDIAKKSFSEVMGVFSRAA